MRERLDLDNKSDFEQRLPKVIGEGDLYSIATSSQDEKTRLLAVGKIRSQRYLERLAFFGDTIIKMAAISRLNSIFILNLIAMTEKDYAVCYAAYDRIIALKILRRQIKINPI